jgi:hypothetical protein
MEKIKEILKLILAVFGGLIFFALFVLFISYINNWDVDASGRMYMNVMMYGVPLFIVVILSAIQWLEHGDTIKKKLKLVPKFVHSMNNVQKSFVIIGIMSFIYCGFRSDDFYKWTRESDIILSLVLIIGSGLGCYLFKDDIKPMDYGDTDWQEDAQREYEEQQNKGYDL